MASLEHDAYDRPASQVEHPEAWLPEPGATLVGDAVRWDEVSFERDSEKRACDVLTLRTQDGTERSVWTWHFVLREELVGKVEPGDFVAIHYQGRKANQKGDGDYAAYRIAIEKGDGSVTPPAQDDGIPF
jgi:hypothetical protein